MANRTLNFEAGNGNWWWRCNHKRKALIGSEHTFHWLHWHTSCSFSGKNGWKLWGNYAILVSLITDSGGNSWCPWLYFLRAYHPDNLCSSKSDVRLRFWSWYDLKKLLWPSWTQHSGLLCLWQCLVETPGPAFYNQIEKWKGRQHSLLNKALISNIIFPLNALLQSRLFLNME